MFNVYIDSLCLSSFETLDEAKNYEAEVFKGIVDALGLVVQE